MAQRPIRNRNPESKPPENETPAQKFVRIGKRRIAKALTALEAVERLSGRAYACTDEQAEKVCNMLTDATQRACVAFKNRNQASAAKQREIDL